MNLNPSKNINNTDDNQLSDNNEEHNIPDKIEVSESAVLKRHTPENIAIQEDLNYHGAETTKHTKPTGKSRHSNLLNEQVQDIVSNDSTIISKQLGLEVSTTVLSNNDKIQVTKTTGQSRKISHPINMEFTHRNEDIDEIAEKESILVSIQPDTQYKVPHAQDQQYHQEPSEQKKIDGNVIRASIQSRKATSPSLQLKVPPMKPEKGGVVQHGGSFISTVGGPTSIKTQPVPGTSHNHNLSEQTTKKPEEAAVTEGLSQQTLYVRVMKKLPTTGPLSINDLDEFLKKSKTDFEHYYQKKPMSNIQITHFKLIKTLGMGSFGKVVLGELKAEKTLYAIKIIDKVGVIKRNHVRYVSNEKRVLQGLNFPFVINLKYFFTDFYYLYFVLPFIPGGNLQKHLKVCRNVKESEARFYIGQLVLALEYLHYLDLIHRDVKTENIMIDAFGYLKLVDFGQCIRIYGNDKTWTYTGTLEYMAPEIMVGKGYDCAVDWWALGVILFEICAGSRPFKDENTHKLQMQILCNQYSIPPTFTRSLKKLIESLLVLEPKKRIANCSKRASQIKKHIWFKELNWLSLLNRTLEAPFIPILQNCHKIS